MTHILELLETYKPFQNLVNAEVQKLDSHTIPTVLVKPGQDVRYAISPYSTRMETIPPDTNKLYLCEFYIAVRSQLQNLALLDELRKRENSLIELFGNERGKLHITYRDTSYQNEKGWNWLTQMLSAVEVVDV